MKTMPLLLAGAIAATPMTAPAPEQKMTLIEGFCAGLVIGLSADVAIVVYLKCKRGHSTNSPPVLHAPVAPPATNAPPTNAVHTASLDGSGIEWFDFPEFSAFTATLQSSFDLRSWDDALILTGWQTAAGQTVLATTPDGTPVCTNFTAWGSPFIHWLPMPNLANEPRRFFRLRSP
jgi:hypothetical protein